MYSEGCATLYRMWVHWVSFKCTEITADLLTRAPLKSENVLAESAMVWSWFASSRGNSITIRNETWNQYLPVQRPSVLLLVCGFSHANGEQLGRSRQHALAAFFNTSCDMAILHNCHTKHKQYIIKSNRWYKSHPHAPHLLQLFSETNTSFFLFFQQLTHLQTSPHFKLSPHLLKPCLPSSTQIYIMTY